MSDPAEAKAAGAAHADAAASATNIRSLHGAAVEALRSGKIQQGIEGLTKVVALDPSLASAHNNMGAALFILGRFDAAAAWYRQAVQLGDADARGNLGEAYRKLGRFTEAETCQRDVLARRPDDQTARFALAQTLGDAGWLDDALACFDDLLKRSPDHVNAAWNRALVLLQLGRYDEGFPAFETRFQRPKSLARKFDMPRWDGAPLDGRTILVHDEPSLTDGILFARFVPLVAARGGRVVVECQAPLVRLMQSLEGVSQVVERGTTAPACEFEAPLLSLPAILGIRLETLPAPGRYLTAPADLRDRFAPITARPAGTLKVGIVWAGRGELRDDDRRSAGLAPFIELIGVPGVALFALQVGPRAGDLGRLGVSGLIIDLSPRLADFAATAAAIETLDLVVSVDSAAAHLAGALGKPVWLALGSTGDWRYLAKRTDSPWYPTMRLFRQSRFGDWDPVFRNIAAALELRDGLAGGRPR